MTPTPDVLIVGSGVIGLSTAYLLAKRGLRVTVLDRGEPGRESSWAGAGIIPPGNPAAVRHPMDHLRAESSMAFPTWATDLESFTGIRVGYRVCGGLELFDEEPADLTALWRAEGIAFERLSAEESAALCPDLVSAPATYHFPWMAQVRNPWYLKALLAATDTLGVKVIPHQEVAVFETAASRVTAVWTQDGARHEAGKYLLSPGAWGGRLLKWLGVSLPVRPVRGQLVLFLTPPDLLPKIVSVGKNYFVPRGDGRLLVGATEDPDAGFDKSATAANAETLTRFAVERIPALATATVEQTWAGLRPGSPGGVPFIGPVPGFTNAFFAGGHYRAGIQLSPATAIVTSQLLTDETPGIDLTPFRLDRPTTEPYVRPFQS